MVTLKDPTQSTESQLCMSGMESELTTVDAVSPTIHSSSMDNKILCHAQPHTLPAIGSSSASQGGFYQYLRCRLNLHLGRLRSFKSRLAKSAADRRRSYISGEIDDRTLVFIELFAGTGKLTTHVKKHKSSKVITITTDFYLGGIDFRDQAAIARFKDELTRFQDDGLFRVVVSAAPPCRTLSKARDRSRKTRVRSKTHVWGLPPIPLDVQEANMIAVNTAEFLVWAKDHLKAWVMAENPAYSYLWELPPWKALLDLGFLDTIFNVCRYGGEYLKPTRLRPLLIGWHFAPSLAPAGSACAITSSRS